MRAEAVVGEALGGVGEGVAGELEADVDCFDGGAVGSGGFVRVELNGAEEIVSGDRGRLLGRWWRSQSPEAALDCFFCCIVGNTKVLIKVSGDTKLVVCFVDCVQQVGDDHKDVDSSSIADEAWRARCWFGVTGANEDCIESGLDVAGHHLSRVNITALDAYIREYMLGYLHLPLARNTIRLMRENRSPT